MGGSAFQAERSMTERCYNARFNQKMKKKNHVSPLFENSRVDVGSYKQICVSGG